MALISELSIFSRANEKRTDHLERRKAEIHQSDVSGIQRIPVSSLMMFHFDSTLSTLQMF